MKEKIAEMEFGCGGKMADGFPCTSLGSAPCLCGECIQLLPTKILALIEQEQKPMREALELTKMLNLENYQEGTVGNIVYKAIDAVLGGSHE